MTLKYFFGFLLIPILSIAQMSKDVPWLDKDTKAITNLSMQEISAKANAYFSKINITKKGSGYKPFKRSEYHWNFYLEQNGQIATADKLWKAWSIKKSMEQSRNSRIVSDWQSVGPNSYTDTGSWSSGQGRVNVVVVDPSNTSTYYAGAPAGGIWKSTDAGQTWSPLSDNLPQIGVSGIAIDPNNANIIYITTGDDDFGNTYFVGVKKSIDGGQTWNNTGTINANSANEIYIDPTNSNTIWVATSNGLYKSIDAGDSWDNKKNGNIKDFKLKPGDPNTIYAVSKNTFYKSTDAGATFNTITSGLPNTSSRLTIDITPANADYVYVLSANNNNFQGVYKSTNSGASFQKTLENNDIFDGSGQTYYDMAFCVSDTDPDILFAGVLNIWKSTNAGDHFTRINSWSDDTADSYTHADIHFLRYYNNQLFAGTDGGVYRSLNNGSNFTNLTDGMAIGQFYKISVSKQSANNIAGGLQDNGGYAYSNNQWYNYYGADGMDAAIDPTNQNTYYGFIQSGRQLYKTTTAGLNSSFVTSKPAGESGRWVTPLVTNNNGTVYAGYNQLYKLVNGSWQQVSNYNFGGRLSNIKIASNNTLIFVSKSKNLYKSTDAGITFTPVNHVFQGSFISSIETHNNNIIWISTSGSNGKIYKSSDAGTTWVDITNNLSNESKTVIRHQKNHPDNPLYVGTTLGVYYKDDTSSNWEVFSTNLPNVMVSDLEVSSNEGILTASTYGRGVWQSAIPIVLANDDIKLVSIINPSINIECAAITPIIQVKNNGLNAISTIDINYSIDNVNHNQTWTGNLASGEIIDINLQEFNLAKGQHDLTVTTTIANDSYADNNTLSVSFLTNEQDIYPIVVNSFENASDSWLVNTSNSDTELWQMSAPGTSLLNTVASGSKAYITNPNGNYPNAITSDLLSPCYDLSSIDTPVLSFEMAFDIEENWDVLYMQYSIDNGNTWEVLGTADDANWYNSSASSNDLTIGKQWSGSVTALTNYTYNLSSLANENAVIFRFHFASDQNISKEGALIDDFVILGNALGIKNTTKELVQLFPNPNYGAFHIKWTSDKAVEIMVFDSTGKSLHKQRLAANSNTLIKLHNYHRGIYFIKFLSNNQQFTKKLIIE